MAFSQFDRVPNHYAGSIIQRVKDMRLDHGKRSLLPTVLRVGELEFLIPRYFGFCFGVERAIHMAFAALDKNPDRNINLVSQIIHNPVVNTDLQERGIRFVYDENGKRNIPEDDINDDDVVLIPAFGTTLEIESSLSRSGIDTSSAEFRENYDTTCPFVSKVWDRGEQLGLEGYTIIIHGKFRHEETQATQSHTKKHGHTLVVLNEAEAAKVCEFIVGKTGLEEFRETFEGKWSADFDPSRDLERVAVVNQTTMLAEETRQVASIICAAMVEKYGEETLAYHFADTNDTLCYATNQNQNATKRVLDAGADVAVIVGGYNSSNTTHLVEICSQVMPSYLIATSAELLSRQHLRHFDIETREIVETEGWLPQDPSTRIVVTSGASCPDVLMNEVVEKIAGFYGYGLGAIEQGLENLSLLDVGNTQTA
jgi:4-hydroxy-3-methylbut-2-enyl diphosphate reductase